MPVCETLEQEFIVGSRLLTDGPTASPSVPRGTIPVKVLSTPGTIGMMERTAAMLAIKHLPEDTATVRFEVRIKHVVGVVEGTRCVARATVREVADGRKWCFDGPRASRAVSQVTEGERTLGVGTHERRTVQRA